MEELLEQQQEEDDYQPEEDFLAEGEEQDSEEGELEDDEAKESSYVRISFLPRRLLFTYKLVVHWWMVQNNQEEGLFMVEEKKQEAKTAFPSQVYIICQEGSRLLHEEQIIHASLHSERGIQHLVQNHESRRSHFIHRVLNSDMTLDISITRKHTTQV